MTKEFCESALEELHLFWHYPCSIKVVFMISHPMKASGAVFMQLLENVVYCSLKTVLL